MTGIDRKKARKESTVHTFLETRFCPVNLIKKFYDIHLNEYTEIIRRYLIDGGAGNIMQKLGIGIQIITTRAVLLPEEIITRRFIWLKGNRTGKLLERNEIEAIGMFLPGGALYGKEDNYKWQ